MKKPSRKNARRLSVCFNVLFTIFSGDHERRAPTEFADFFKSDSEAVTKKFKNFYAYSNCINFLVNLKEPSSILEKNKLLFIDPTPDDLIS